MEMQFLGGRRQLRQALRILGWMLAIIVWRNCFVPGLASPVPIWAVINSTAELPCSHNIGCVESLVNFRVYWQKNKTVLFELNEGKIELKHQNKAYVNRTTLHSNCSLLLFAIQVSDEGTYDCYLLKREGNEYKSPLHLSVALTVTAPFSQPIILKESSAKGTTVNLTCLSYGGYPKATIVWYNVTGNATLNSSFSSTSFIQDPETQTYNMSSHLVMEITAPFSVACSVQSTYLPERNSTIWIEILPPQTPDLKDIISIVVGIASSVMIIVATFMVVKNCSPCSKEKKLKNSYSPPEEQRTAVHHEETNLDTRL
ncbi:T-lymphocyte activation antigen CD80 [Microcaecilia unicolor]|uniref:T-lymphocyte activation antigen CD80-like n=1 Tax=Microcaecilia unicolor TaxID=1415580 RepID=A0A6P7YA92_9AMPH|nr:T-lymphocyte activation antigen CD80-like [Microcaecilia unicolor]